VKHALVADNCNNCGGSGGGSSSEDFLGVVPSIPQSFYNWISSNLISSSRPFTYIMQDTKPNYSKIFTIVWYNTSNNSLNLISSGGTVIPIDWRYLIKSDLWYGLGKLKLENNVIKVSNDGNNWLTIFPGIGVVNPNADDTNPNDDYKIFYAFADYYNSQFVRRYGSNTGAFTKTRIACVSPSVWNVRIQQTDNQEQAGWIGLHLGDVDISDGQGKMTQHSSSFDTTNYNDISNAKFLPLAWFTAKNQNDGKYCVCDATITIKEDNTITVSSRVYKPNDQTSTANFTCSGTFPSSANHLGSVVYNGNIYYASEIYITRQIFKFNV
jgi:hypothetical protein